MTGAAAGRRHGFGHRPWAIALAVVLVALVLLAVSWQTLVVAGVARALARAVGHRVTVASVRPGWRTFTARDVIVFGAPPFESAALARVDRLSVRLGGPGFGFWAPAEVSIDHVQLTYLRSGRLDNVGSARAGGGARPSGARPVVMIRDGHLDGYIRWANGQSASLRGETLEGTRDGTGALAVRAGGLSVELVGVATLAIPRLRLSAQAGQQRVNADDVRLVIPAGGALLDRMRVEATWADGRFDVAVAREGAAHDRIGTVQAHVAGGGRPERAQIQIERLPLAPLRPLLRRIGVDSAETQGALTLDAARGADGTYHVHGAGRVSGLDVHNPRLDRQPWSGLAFAATADAIVTLSGTTVDRLEVTGARLEAPGLPLDIKGWSEPKAPARGAWHLQTPAGRPAGCESLLAAQPPPVKRTLRGLVLTGRLGLSVDLAFDASAWDDLALDVSIAPRCQAVREPAVLEDLLPTLLGSARQPHPWRDLPLDRHHGDFVPINKLPRHLVDAFMTAEDGRFRTHDGFDLEMIRRALGHDLEMGGVAKGASTITQQLAKNLFLDPERTFGRKLEEMVLAWRLHERLSKQRQLELYLNVIELGPGIRGVGRAAQVYFGKPASALDALEAAHLASLTPNPIGYARRFRDGRVDDGWMNHLYDLLGMMNRSGRLTAGELAAARSSRLVLRRLR